MTNALDKLVNYVAPGAGLKRATARAKVEMLSSMSGTSGYLTAGSMKRSMQGWLASKLSPDSDVLPKHSSQIASSRDLYMNTPMAGAILRRLCSASVGSGLNLQSRVDRAALGLSDEAADAWERKVEGLWRIFAESKDADITRTMNFYQLQALVFFNRLLSGDVFFMLPWVPVAGCPFETRIKIIEADLCRNPELDSASGEKAGGIELDQFGAPKAYWFSKNYPSGQDLVNVLSVTDEFIRVPAFDAASGRRNVHHVFERERPGQRRGTPLLSRVFETLKQITRLGEAKLMHHLLQSFFTVFVTNETGVAQLDNPYGIADTAQTPTDYASGQNVELGNANIIELDENRKISVADPGRSDIGYGTFFDSLIAQVAANVGIPAGTLMLRFQASYSATRGERLEFEREYMAARRNFSYDFCQQVYEAWLYEVVSKGLVEAPGFLEDPIKRKQWSRAKWNGAGLGQIDPLKETEAAISRINAYLSTHEDEYAVLSEGGDWDNTINRLSREDKAIKDSGVLPMSQPAKADKMIAQTKTEQESL